MISNWNEVDWQRKERGHIVGEWQPLTGERSEWLGVQRIRVDAGKWATPLHLEGSEEEIFYVLSGSGFSVQSDDGSADAQAYAVGAGDCLVHRALEHAHTIGAGPEGIEVLAFGERHYAANTLLPRAGVSWLGATWVRAGSKEDHPWSREAEVGPPVVGELSERVSRIVNIDDVAASERRGATVSRSARNLGGTAGALKTGLNLYDVDPGKLMNPPHAHSEEEEIFVVLSGSGSALVWPHPRAAGESGRWPDAYETHPLQEGSVVAVPAGRGRAVALEAGPEGMRVLAYGMRRPGDVCFYPRSGKISFRGVGIIGRLEQVPYWDGED